MPDKAGAEGGIDQFGFRFTDETTLDEAIEQVVHASGVLVERGEHGPGAPYAYVRDPDGYLIEL